MYHLNTKVIAMRLQIFYAHRPSWNLGRQQQSVIASCPGPSCPAGYTCSLAVRCQLLHVCLLSRHNNYRSMQHATVRDSKTHIICLTHKLNLRIDWEFGNKLILSISTELCQNCTLQDHKMDL